MSSSVHQQQHQQPQHRGKRNYQKSKSKPKCQPKRGGPGIILTCEAGRETKAKREGLQILNYYLNNTSNSNNRKKEEQEEEEDGLDNDNNNDNSKNPKAKASLDDELAQLKSANNTTSSNDNKHCGNQHHHGSTKNSPFVLYDTGCRGIVFVLSNLPNCALVPLTKLDNKDDANNDEEAEEPSPKKVKRNTEGDESVPSTDPPPAAAPAPALDKSGVRNAHEPETEAAASATTTTTTVSKVDDATTTTPPWDPVETVRRVMDDLHKESAKDSKRNCTSKSIPGSRFISRMIPIQVTCFAAIPEIGTTFRSLIDNLVLLPMKRRRNHANNNTAEQQPQQPPIVSFSIKFKKRNCGHITRDQVIETIVAQVDDATNSTWKVDLEKPDYRIQVEISKTLCGMSILAASQQDAFMAAHNFNLADLRAAAAVAETDDE